MLNTLEHNRLDMIVTSLQHFKPMYIGELVGDNYEIVRNVVKYGAPSSMRMKIDLTKKLGNYARKADQGYIMSWATSPLCGSTNAQTC